MKDNLILLVEDDEDDIYFMRRAMKDAGLANRLEVLRNGEEAIQYLNGTNGFADRTKYPLPQFMFLDLKMPLANGFDVLQWMKSKPALEIPVAVLSSSPEDKDMKRSRELGAACYLIKPPTPQMLQSCWLQFGLKR